MFSHHSEDILVKLLAYTRTQHTQADWEYIRNLGFNKNDIAKHFLKGCCFGLSVVNGVMQKTGKATWFEAAKEAILSWDERKESLQKTFILPDANDQTPVSLQQIFERILSYISFSHADHNLYPFALSETAFNQFNFLLPGGDFEYLNEKEEVCTVKKNYRAAGYFSVKNLIAVLNEESTKQLIGSGLCFIHSLDHTCELGYQNGIWRFYDSIKDINIYTDNIEDLANMIIDELSNSLTLQIACFDEMHHRPFSHYEDLLFNQPAEIFQENGLLHLVQYSSPKLATLLHHLKKTLTPQQLKDMVNLELTDESGRTAIFHAIAREDIRCINALCEAGANLTAMNTMGATPLDVAIWMDNTTVIALLLSYGAPLHFGDLRTAVQCDCIQASLFFLENFNFELMKTFPVNVADLLSYVRPGNKENFKDYLKTYHKNSLISPQITLLHLAVLNNNITMVTALLEKIGELPMKLTKELQTMAVILDHKEMYYMLQKKQSAFAIESPNSLSTFMKRKATEFQPSSNDSNTRNVKRHK